MKEDLLYYIWKTKSFDHIDLQSVNGQKLEIKNYGQRNIYSGPDLSNCKVLIDDNIWAGSIEFHVNSSDWLKHKHQNDDAYKNVILHVVYNHDKNVIPDSIPTLELKNRVDRTLIERYKFLNENQSWVPCETMLDKISSFTWNIWLERVALERLDKKAERIEFILKENNNDWNETFYIILSRYMGTSANREAFEMLAQSLPLKTILKNLHSEISIEALLFGQAGFLDEQIDNDQYFNQLKAEYSFLKKKYNLKAMNKSAWKLGGVRPNNSPQIRLSQLGQIIKKHKSLFSNILESENPLNILDIKASKYWNSHYYFGKKTEKSIEKKIGKSLIQILAINSFAPSIYTYGKNIKNTFFIEKSIKMLENIKSEKNSIITKWKERKIESNDALQSQALIHLKNEYCQKRKCMDCSIGHTLIKK